jgi:hypothetical protein
MDAVEFIEESARMCDYQNGCCFCPWYSTEFGQSCGKFKNKYPRVAIEKLEKWSKEHPVKSYTDVYNEVMKNAGLSAIGENGFGRPGCVSHVFGVSVECAGANDDCTVCWAMECKLPIKKGE